MSFVDEIKANLITDIQVKEKRPEIFQIIAPFYHEDGDIMEIFIEKNKNNPKLLKICDYGHTLMRLSYDVELNGINEKVYKQILSENQLDESDGNVFIETDLESLNSKFMHYVQSISKISSLHYFKHKRVQSLFYETLFKFIEEEMKEFNPQKDFIPLKTHPENKVDVVFNSRRIPLFLYGVQGDTKASDVIASCLEFKLAKLDYKSIVVYEDFDVLSKKTQKRILRTTDKPFMDFDQFKEEGHPYLIKEAS